jgi:catechol 2,3-dioxygenase-like lactoylglutathione lyase family enzyme
MVIMVNLNQAVTLSTPPKTPPASLLSEIDFAVDDVKAMRSYLATSKVAINDDKKGHFPVVSDPEGHRIGFVQSAAGTESIHLIHAGLVVHDRNAEDRFYKDVLGFHVYWHGGMKEGEDNWVDMQVPDGTDWIEYMLKVPENATHKQLGVMNHIALGVPDIHAAQEQLIKNGWKGTEEPKIGRDGKWQLNLYDPDETRVEMMEFKPTKEPCCSPYTGPHPGPQ